MIALVKHCLVSDVAFHLMLPHSDNILRKQFASKGVKLINSTVEKVNTNDDGRVSNISRQTKITADLYIDCTGFKVYC